MIRTIKSLFFVSIKEKNCEATWHQKKGNLCSHGCVISFQRKKKVPAGRLVRFFSQLFNVGLGIPVFEIHSRMSQASRNRASNSFREARRGILFTSDVSARGIDYPRVSLVLQYGAPANKDSYIHRLGRTARAGNKGKGWVCVIWKVGSQYPVFLSFFLEVHLKETNDFVLFLGF